MRSLLSVFAILLFLISDFTSASTLSYWQRLGWGGSGPARHSSIDSACGHPQSYGYWLVQGETFQCQGGSIARMSEACPQGDNGLYCWAQCVAPNTLVNGQCIVPAPNPCVAKKDQATTWKKVWPSYAASSTLGEKVNNSGCSATIATSSCGTNGATGEFACWGTAKYDGAAGVDSAGPSSACGASDPNCSAPKPLESTNSQKCTPNADGTTTCVTESGSTEFAAGECHVGSTGGATGFVCVKPDYVPEAATNKRTDVIKTEATADGGTKTTTTSTSENKHCVAGVCTNTTTTTTTTTTKDGQGKVTGETSTCTGAKCDKPTDETEPEEEGMGEAKFAGKGGCEGSDCDVNAFNPFGTDVVPGYSDSLNAALTGIKRSPIGSAVSNIRWPTGGSCPVYSMQLFNSSISITEHCTVWDSVGSALRAVFLAIWAFAAVRVFLSA